MNATPHTHDLKVTSFENSYVVTYGDQKIFMFNWLGAFRIEKRIKRQVRRIVREHDIESQKAGRKDAARQAAVEAYALPTTKWSEGAPNADEQARIAREEYVKKHYSIALGDPGQIIAASDTAMFTINTDQRFAGRVD